MSCPGLAEALGPGLDGAPVSAKRADLARSQLPHHRPNSGRRRRFGRKERRDLVVGKNKSKEGGTGGAF